MSPSPIVSQIKPVLLKYGVTKSDIFGSYARGDHIKKSDVDILVELPKGSLFDLIHLQNELEEVLQKDVDVVTYDSVNKYIKKYVFEKTVKVI